VSGGGVSYAWNSTLVIVLLTLGAALYVVFVIYEAKFAKIPIMPSTFSNSILISSAFVHDSISRINPGPDVLRWNCVLWKPILLANLLPTCAASKHHRVWRLTPAAHHHTNLYCDFGGINPRKVSQAQRQLTIEPADTIRAFGSVSACGHSD
jgi:hypothetical protein